MKVHERHERRLARALGSIEEPLHEEGERRLGLRALRLAGGGAEVIELDG